MFIAASNHSIIARTKSAAKASMRSVRAASVFAAASLLRAGAGGPPASRRSACARVEGGCAAGEAAAAAAAVAAVGTGGSDGSAPPLPAALPARLGAAGAAAAAAALAALAAVAAAAAALASSAATAEPRRGAAGERAGVATICMSDAAWRWGSPTRAIIAYLLCRDGYT